jgi:hypothetical protein
VSEGATISSQVPGANPSGTGPRGLISDTRSGADFFAHLISLRDHLQAGNTEAIAATDRPALSKDEDNFIFHLGQNGAIQSRLEAAAASAKDRSNALTTRTSKETDADLRQAHLGR